MPNSYFLLYKKIYEISRFGHYTIISNVSNISKPSNCYIARAKPQDSAHSQRRNFRSDTISRLLQRPPKKTKRCLLQTEFVSRYSAWLIAK